jgi:outer membrane protein assembly factor BamB
MAGLVMVVLLVAILGLTTFAAEKPAAIKPLSLASVSAAENTPSTVWPTEVTSTQIYPNLNPLWGSAISSDINWSYDTNGDQPFTSVVVVDGLAYVGSMMNMEYAFDAVTGKLVWSFEADNWIMTNPIVADGKIFLGSGNRLFPSGNINTIYRGTGSNSLYGLDAKTGKMLWRYQIQGEAMPTPVYKDGIVYYATGDRSIYAIDANTGKLVYQEKIPSYNSMSSVNISGNLIIFGGAFPYQVYAFDVSTRKMAWATPIPTARFGLDDSIPAIANGMVYIDDVGTKDQTYKYPYFQIHALDLKTGEVKWTFNTEVGTLVDDNKSSTPVIVDGTYYGASSATGKFYALDAATGAEKWEFKVGAVVKGNPVIYGNYIFFADARGIIFALDRTNGKLINKKTFGSKIMPQGPTLMNGTLYFCSQSGMVYAVSAANLVTPSLMAPEVKSAAVDGSNYFGPTGHSVSGAFLTYWQQHGGLAEFGYPVTGEIQEFHAAEGKTYTVQYFERARFELHDGAVLLGRVGSEITAKRQKEAAFGPVQAPSGNMPYFKETGHTILPDFYSRWQSGGGLARYGFPVSEPLEEVLADGKKHTVQYFERARFELQGQAVLLGLVGRERLLS